MHRRVSNGDWVKMPNAPDANYYLGLAYLRNGQRTEAADIWQAYKNPREPSVGSGN